MKNILNGLISKVCFVYLGDVMEKEMKETFEEMKQNLNEVFSRLRTANLKINPKKCVLFDREIKHLGHIVSAEGITMDPEDFFR